MLRGREREIKKNEARSRFSNKRPVINFFFRYFLQFRELECNFQTSCARALGKCRRRPLFVRESNFCNFWMTLAARKFTRELFKAKHFVSVRVRPVSTGVADTFLVHAMNKTYIHNAREKKREKISLDLVSNANIIKHRNAR